MGYVRSNLGQIGVPVTPASEGTAVFRSSTLPEIVTGPALPTGAGYYTRFRKVVASQPSLPYEYHVSDSVIEKQIYQNLPKKIPGSQEVQPPASQKVVETPSGLDVPMYILERDVARREAAQKEQEEFAKKSAISKYAANHPGSAALAAVAIGLLSGNFLL